MIICPICGEDLIEEEKSYSCINGHSFDKAKQGHLNLLLSQKSGGKISGDDKSMLLARKEFLNGDFYQNIADKMVSIINSYHLEKLTLVDVGCGEGYYTNYIKKNILTNKKEFFGVDIAKDAVRYAASRSKEISWLVASGVKLPIKNDSIDFVTAMFTRTFDNEFARILKDNGILIIVNSDENHLIELREIIYDEVFNKEEYKPLELDSFIFERRENLKYSVEIDNRAILNLVEMTPHKWRIKEKNREIIKKLEKLTISIEINFDIYKNKKALSS